MNFDELLTLEDHEEGAEINIKHPKTGKETDVFIKVLGPDSREFRKAKKKVFREMFKEEPDEDFDEELETLVAVTVGWRGIVKNGQELKFSKQAVRDLYLGSPNILSQVNLFVGNRKNFTKG